MPNAIPEVGMGATGGWGGTHTPYTIVAISKDGNQLLVQPDSYWPKESNTMAEQDYDYTPDPQAPPSILRRFLDERGDIHWCRVDYGREIWINGSRNVPAKAEWLNNRHKGRITRQYFGIGYRSAYRDPSI